ncbi:MAG: GNAT family N-acetyltransferase [Gemmatimonadaceae bacterium]
MDAKPVTLEGERVRLEPMAAAHLPALIEAGAFEELWRWTSSRADTPDSMREYVMSALADASAGSALPFVTVDMSAGRVIGSTRFGNIDHPNRRVEIGWTWITPAFQRSHVNSEAKYLMLLHAFDVWQCVRVELKTDFLNEKSRNAMLRIGCREEGTLRKHMITYSGRWRDTVYYSVLDSEWPAVRERLLDFIARRDA